MCKHLFGAIEEKTKYGLIERHAQSQSQWHWHWHWHLQARSRTLTHSHTKYTQCTLCVLLMFARLKCDVYLCTRENGK